MTEETEQVQLTNDPKDPHDVYRFRRKIEQIGKFNLLPNRIHTAQDKTSMKDITNDYAVLQEARKEFLNSRLRRIFYIYSSFLWKIFIVAVLTVSYFIDTTLYTFYQYMQRPTEWVTTLVILNVLYTVDFFFILGLKLFEHWRKTLNFVEPDSWRVLFEGILAIPYSILYYFNYSLADVDVCIIAPIIAMIRAYRIIEFFYINSSQAGRNQWITFIIKYLILLIIAVHTWACLWCLFAYTEYDVNKVRESWSFTAVSLPTQTSFDWYYVSAYFSIMLLTTNALGEIYPLSTVERISGTIAVLCGFLLTTLVFVGSLTSQFITLTAKRSRYVKSLNKIAKHLSLINMDTETARRIVRYYEDLWYQKSGVFKPKLLKLLPYPLQMEIFYDLNAVPLYSSLIFRKLPEAFLRRLSLTMSHQFYLPGDIVYNHDQNKTSMVCITSGVLELLSDEDDDSPMISFTKGTCLGEISMVYNIPARCTVKAATYVECQILHKKDFIKMMITYPDLIDTIREEISMRIERCKKRILVKDTKATLSLNIYATKDRKKSSIKCLKDKLRYLQGLIDEDTLTKEDHLDENCLDLYVISEHEKKKVLSFTCITERFPWILESDCVVVKVWEAYMLLLVAYICIVYPYMIGFERKFEGHLLVQTDIVVTLSIAFNILMISCTAVKTKKTYHRTLQSILNYRMNTLGFYLDILSIIPFEHLITVNSDGDYWDYYKEHLFYICKGTKLCLIWRMSSFFESLEKKLLINTIYVKIIKYLVYIVLLCYWCGVILYMESCFTMRCSESSWFSNTLIEHIDDNIPVESAFPLIASIYFATAIILSVGYGDFIPGDKYDMTVVAFLSIYGLFLVGYCVAEFSAVITHWSSTKTSFLEVVLTIDKFMLENKMEPNIKSRIISFYELQWQYNLGVEVTGNSWLSKTVIPLELKKKVLHQARFKALTSIKLFQVKNKAYIQTLIELAREIILPPNEIVNYGGTVSREMYIIVSGYCLVTNKMLKEEKKERILGPGEHLGMMVMLYGTPASYTAITLTHCKLLCIGHSEYTSALSLFPDMREHEDLLSSDELKLLETMGRSENFDASIRNYTETSRRTHKNKITNYFQQIIDDSFIDLIAEYTRNKESYNRSFKQFRVLNKVAPYVLLPYVIKPNGLFLQVWSIIRVVSAYLLCLLIPINAALAPQCGDIINVIIFLECISYIDLYIRMHVAYYGSKNQLIYHPYLTAKKYITGAFIVDSLTCLPWYALANIGFISSWPNNDPRYGERRYCVFRLVNVLQIYKFYSPFWADSVSALKRAYLMSVVQFLFLTLFFLNLNSSVLLISSCQFLFAKNKTEFDLIVRGLPEDIKVMSSYDPNGNMICTQGTWIDSSVGEAKTSSHITPMKAYLMAMYWTTGTFTCAGFGNYSTREIGHLILAILVILQGVFFFGYVYAKIASLKAVADQVSTKFHENIKHLEILLNKEKVPFYLRRTVLEFWKYQWKRTRGWSHQSILGKLHANLNEDAVLFMYEKTLRDIPLFEGVEYSFFRAFAKKLKERYYQKGYMIVRANEVMSELNIIYRGKVDIISQFNETEACMGPGGIFGNIKGAAKYMTMSNIIASRNIDILCINGAEFYALLKSYPTVMKKVKQSIEHAVKDYVIPTVNSAESLEVEDSKDNVEEEDEPYEIFSNISSPEKSVAESHGSRSLASLVNIDNAANPLSILLPHKIFRRCVIPDSKFVMVLDILFMIIGYIDFTLLVYQMTFRSNEYFFYICAASDFVFMYKTFLDMHTGFINRYGDYVLQPNKVRKMFFSKKWSRRRDALSLMLICYISLALPLPNDEQEFLFCYMRTPQLFRITYVLMYDTHKKMNINASNLFFKLANILLVATVMSHVGACIFFKLSCITGESCITNNWMTNQKLNLMTDYAKDNYFSIYIASLWYVVNLLTITGMGDISAKNDFELLETIVIVIMIKFGVGLLISEMSSMITAHSSSLIDYDFGISQLRDGLRDMGLSQHQLGKMWDYVKQLWNRQQGRQMPELISEMPFRLRCQVMQALYGSHIKQSVIFSRTDDDFQRMLSMWLKHCVFFPGNYIVQSGDADQCIYFVHRGEVEVLTVHPNLTESIYDILGPEDCFGVAQGLFVGISHHFSFRARTTVDIVYLRLEEWKYLLDFYPKSAKVVRRKVEQIYLAL